MEKSSLNEPLAFWQNFFHILQKYYVSLYMQNSVKVGPVRCSIIGVLFTVDFSNSRKGPEAACVC